MNHANRCHLETPDLHSWNIKQTLQLFDQRPLIIADIRPVIFLQCIYALPTDQRIESVLFFPMSAVNRLVGTLDFDRDGGLTALYHFNLFVVALD